MQIIFLRELTPSIIPAPPHSLKKGFSSCQRLFSFIYCSASGCQPQSLSKLLVIKYYLFFHLRKLQKPTKSLRTTVRVLKDWKWHILMDIQPWLVFLIQPHHYSQ